MAAFIPSVIFAAAIALDGVSGSGLSVSARFDANNVRLGDPVTLTLDFSGDADFSTLHPPALSAAADRAEWRIDDESARTDTASGSRCITYRARPVKEGVLWFPELVFTYSSPTGRNDMSMKTVPVPVSVRKGSQAALANVHPDEENLPMPDGITVDLAEDPGEDALFRWRKACRAANAAAFSVFDFPEAKMNEAACRIVEGEWAKALSIYSSLEWRIGQTPEMERGIVAALSRKTGAPAELPVLRQILRPVLKYSWRGRLAVCAGAAVALFLACFLAGRIARMLAAFAVLLSVSGAARAQSPFDAIDRMMEEMRNRQEAVMRSMQGMGGGHVVNLSSEPDIEAVLSVAPSKSETIVGETFDLVFSLETASSVSLENLRFSASENFGIAFEGRLENLADAASSNPSNIVRRWRGKARFDIPFKGSVWFTVSGMANAKVVTKRAGFSSSISFMRQFSAKSAPFDIDVRTPPGQDRPPDYSGASGSGFSLSRRIAPGTLRTNDVATVAYTLKCAAGRIPAGAFPSAKQSERGIVEWTEYFVADGAKEIPARSVSYYDTAKHAYGRVAAGPDSVVYVPDDEPDDAASEGKVAMDASAQGAQAKVVNVLFAPAASAPVVAKIPADLAKVAPRNGKSGKYVRIDAGTCAGWVSSEDAE